MRSTLQHLFTPHHSNNHRARLLQPAGLSVVIGIFLLTQSGLGLLRYIPDLPGGLVLGFASSITPGEVVTQTNTERAKVGLEPLVANSALSQAAAAKANHMFAQNYWAHIAPDGTTPWEFIKSAGYAYSVAGENLARDFGDTGSMVAAWMGSETHKENILNGKYSQIGVAVVDGVLEGVETTLVVQMFGNPAGTQVQTTQTAATDLQPAAQPAVTTAPAMPESIPGLARLEAKTGETLPQTLPSIAPTSIPVPQELTGVRLSRPETLSASAALLSPLIISKAISATLILLMVGLLLYDTAVMHRKNLPRLVGKNWAHIAFYSIMLVIIMAITQGKVL